MALGSVFAGCAAPGEVSVPASSQQEAPKLDNLEFDPTVPLGRDLAIYNKGRALSVGESEDEALRVFPAPTRSYPSSSLPAQFGDKFKAVGWDSDQISFGCILYAESKEPPVIVLAMSTREGVSEEDVTKAETLYKKEYGEPELSLPGKDVVYMIWERPGRRLMLNLSTNSKGSRALTVAAGVPEVMGEIGMSQDKARTDWQAARDALSGNPQR